MFKEQKVFLSLIIVFLAISLTVSSIDTLINAISSLIVVDVKHAIDYKGDSVSLSQKGLIIISIIALMVASKGLSILYLFLLADLFCCSAVLSQIGIIPIVFFGFYLKHFDERRFFYSILAGLFAGLLFFPSPDFTKSILVGVIIPIEYFPIYISQSLLFLSFIFATFLPILFWKLNFFK